MDFWCRSPFFPRPCEGKKWRPLFRATHRPEPKGAKGGSKKEKGFPTRPKMTRRSGLGVVWRHEAEKQGRQRSIRERAAAAALLVSENWGAVGTAGFVAAGLVGAEFLRRNAKSKRAAEAAEAAKAAKAAEAEKAEAERKRRSEAAEAESKRKAEESKRKASGKPRRARGKPKRPPRKPRGKPRRASGKPRRASGKPRRPRRARGKPRKRRARGKPKRPPRQ